MFAGIGGFREGLCRAGGFECVGHCERDEHAERSYRALFDTRGEWFCEDIRKADTGSMPAFELLCGGFPCQSFSIAGSRHGFADPRGTLFFELARVAEARKPQYLLFENVPGLLNHDGGRTLEWRCFESTLHAGVVRANITLALAISAQAINQTRTLAKKTPVTENPAFTFRTFLLRLGLVGEEYKNVRMHLLKDLPGDPAWRYDRSQYVCLQNRRTEQQEAR